MKSCHVFSFDTAPPAKTDKTDKTPKDSDSRTDSTDKTHLLQGGFVGEEQPQAPMKSGFAGFDGFDSDPEAPPAFPSNALPPIAREMAKEITKAALVPESLAAGNVLGILSASIGAGLLVDSGGRATGANLYLLGIAQSGTGKGQAYKLAAKAFHEIETGEIDHWQSEGLPGVKTELRLLERRIKQAEKDLDAKKEPTSREQATRDLHELDREKSRLERLAEFEPGFSVGDVTKEKLAMTLESQPGQALASLSPEGRGVIDVLQGRYNGGKNSDEDIYLSGYSRESMKVSRVSRPPVHLKTPTLAVLWLIQPDKARELAESPAMTESGLLPRFLLFDSKAEAMDEPESPHHPDTAKLDEWRGLLEDLLTKYRANGDDPKIIQTSPKARKVIVEYTNAAKARTRKGGDLQDLTPFATRWGENAWRLALVLHAAQWGTASEQQELDEETARQAVAIAKWFNGEFLRFIAPTRSDKGRERLRKLLSILDDHQGERTLRDLGRLHGFEREEVEQLAKDYPERVTIEENRPEGGKGGRPSTVAKRVIQRA